MKTDFSIENSTFIAKRTFNAPVHLLWKAYTEAAELDKWWAPKPWRSETKFMDFRIGGYRLYAMVGPEGEKHWGKTFYETIDEPRKFTGSDAFCDEEGLVNPELPVAQFVNQFIDKGDQTELVITTIYASEEFLQQVLKMGMKEGLNMAFDHLEEALNRLQ